MSSSRVQDQRLFGAYFAAATGLSPQVVGKWLAAEQGPGSAATPGSNNWLNIQYTDSGPNSTYFHIAHMDPRSAALASAQWLKQQSGLRGILAAAGKGVQAEARAIENSGWASSHYGGGLAAVPGYPLPNIGGRAGARTASLGGEGGVGSAPVVPGQLSVAGGEGGGQAAALIGQALAALQAKPAQVPIGTPPAPAHSAAPVLPSGAQPIPGVAPAQPRDESLSRLLEAAQQAASSGGSEPHVVSTGPQQIEGQQQPLQGVQADEKLQGVVNFHGKQVAAWIAPILSYAQAHGWKGTVSSGYRSFAEQQRIYDSGVRPAAVPGTSNHEGKAFPRGAIDATEAQQLARILSTSPYRGALVYAGAKDPVHFSHPHGGGY